MPNGANHLSLNPNHFVHIPSKNKQAYFVLLSDFALSLRLINKPFDIVTR